MDDIKTESSKQKELEERLRKLPRQNKVISLVAVVIIENHSRGFTFSVRLKPRGQSVVELIQEHIN